MVGKIISAECVCPAPMMSEIERQKRVEDMRKSIYSNECVIEKEWRVRNPVFDKKGEKTTTMFKIRLAKSLDELELVSIPCQHGTQNSHRQVVSANGYLVDVGIKQLVDTLDAIPKVETFESCEGGNREPAFVLFNYTGTAEETLRFAQSIAEHFRKQSQHSTDLINPAYELDISVKWCGDKIAPFIELCMPPEVIDNVASRFSHGEIGECYGT